MRMLLIVFLLIAAPRAWAQSPEEAYVAARVRTGAVLEEKSKTGGSAWDAAYDQAKSDLAAQLRRVMGPVPSPKGLIRSSGSGETYPASPMRPATAFMSFLGTRESPSCSTVRGVSMST